MIIIAVVLSVAAMSILIKLEILSHARLSTMANLGNVVVGAKSSSLDILLGALNLEEDGHDFVPQNIFETLKTKKISPLKIN